MRKPNLSYHVSFAALAYGLGMAGVTACRAGTITITPTFEGSYATNTAVKAGINAAIAEIQSDVSTATASNLSVSIDFKDTASGLGASSTYISNITYAQYRSALVSRSTSSNDSTALANLPNTSSYNGASTMVMALPLLRSLGFNVSSGTFDSTISLNTSIMNLSRTGPQNSSNYDLQTVAMHEIDEVLGIGGTGSNLGSSDQATVLGSLDVFRFSAPNVISYTTSSSATAYFSINAGTTNIRGFNQSAGADYADWLGGGGPRVQDAFGTPGTYSDLGTPELTAYDVIGYTVVPEPTAMAFLGLGAIGCIRRRRAR